MRLLLSPRSPPALGSSIGRAGRVTAPVGRVSEVPVVVVSAGSPGLGSLPLKTRARRSSLSNGTPGVRSAAPVGRARVWVPVSTRAGRAIGLRSARSPPLPPELVDPSAGRAGRSPRRGSEATTRLASTSFTGRNLTLSLPRSFAGKDVTARRYAGLVRRRYASSSDRSGLNRSLLPLP